MQPCEQVMYYNGQEFFILKLTGTLRFMSAPLLEHAFSLLESLQDQEVIIDMTETKYLDSTILGSIVKFFLKLESQQAKEIKRPIIVCQNNDVIHSFKKIGFDKFFNFAPTDKRLLQSEVSFVKVEEIAQDEQELEKSVLEAHQALSKLNPKDLALKLVLNTLKNK